MVTHLSPSFHGGIAEIPVKLSYQILQILYMWLFIDALNPNRV